MNTLLLLFILWQAPSGDWTRVGHGSSEAGPNPYAVAEQYCKLGTVVLSSHGDNVSRLVVHCEAK